ncbi:MULTISPECIES: NAD(P)-dependent oxidoreductase [unclassified Actinobaculum]|uniref:NAD(P)-dependent oxidoreductase n=1 Tax=unclassified Actinobaculum TaxID=2609299 RepID=UPI000D5266A3|nr:MULTISPECIES: NAD(P)-dependent oxidoreductase [unclassified Actinobaculum]AWE41901.1 hydroxyacid dehydrogenase [Actinobaculum sp. 313]RTE50183.1 NAD(P)-dependent oxidoreductase [Actinobaculum sp. 352]
MRIAFLGTGRMGTELALRLLAAGHELRVWNRTAAKAEPVVDAGATFASPADAVVNADLVMTCLFGPDTVRDVVLGTDLLPAGVTWADITTISPADAAAAANWAEDRHIKYVHTPVVGTLGPARAGTLGVYVGGTDPQARKLVTSAVSAYADPSRLRPLETAAEAATAKLLANLALAVTAQGVAEAIRLGASQGFSPDRVLDLLAGTSLSWMARFKRDFALERDTADAQFSANAIAKDARLMLHSANEPLPATTAALESLVRAQRAGLGEHDFSVILREESDRAREH